MAERMNGTGVPPLGSEMTGMGTMPDKNMSPPSRVVSTGGMESTPVTGKTMMGASEQAKLKPQVTPMDTKAL